LSAGIFLLLNIGTITQNGAGIPMATDIAFAIEFYLFGKSSSYFAQSILTALAVIDDWVLF
jgi:NhaA family Na+:H+ antiporter